MDGPYEPFMTMKSHIDELMSAQAAERIGQLRADLLLIKAGKPEEYERIRQSLKRALDIWSAADQPVFSRCRPFAAALPLSPHPPGK